VTTPRSEKFDNPRSVGIQHKLLEVCRSESDRTRVRRRRGGGRRRLGARRLRLRFGLRSFFLRLGFYRSKGETKKRKDEKGERSNRQKTRVDLLWVGEDTSECYPPIQAWSWPKREPFE
jgi:hypothetical protein